MGTRRHGMESRGVRPPERVRGKTGESVAPMRIQFVNPNTIWRRSVTPWTWSRSPEWSSLNFP